MNIIKKIVKHFSPLTMEMEVDRKKYRLKFVDYIAMQWLVSVKDLSTKKTIGYIDISDESIVNRTIGLDATREIERLIQVNEFERERKNKRKESIKYYFGD